MKTLKFLGWVAVGVIVVEIGLSMTLTPIAPQSVLAIMIFGTFVVAFMVALFLFVFVFLLRDRHRERTAFVYLAEQASEDHRQALDAVVTISREQARTVAAAVAMGAQLVQLPTGEYGAKLNGKTALLSEAEAAHFYDLQEQE
jgi:hypothetical protein